MPYYKGLMDVVNTMRHLAKRHDAQVKFTFDSRIESEHNAGILYGMLRETPETKHMFPEIGFDCSREQPRVQAADLLAREVMKSLDNKIGPVKRPPRESWLALLETKRFDSNTMDEADFERVRNQMSEFEREHDGMKQYRDWIARNGLQENPTNVFRFVHSVLPKYLSRTKERPESDEASTS